MAMFNSLLYVYQGVMKFHCSRVVVVFLVDTGKNQSLRPGDPENPKTPLLTGHLNRIDVHCNQQRFVQELEVFFPYTGNGDHTTYKNGDNWWIVYCFTHINDYLVGSLEHVFFHILGIILPSD